MRLATDDGQNTNHWPVTRGAVFYMPVQWATPRLQWAAGEQMRHLPPLQAVHVHVDRLHEGGAPSAAARRPLPGSNGRLIMSHDVGTAATINPAQTGWKTRLSCPARHCAAAQWRARPPPGNDDVPRGHTHMHLSSSCHALAISCRPRGALRRGGGDDDDVRQACNARGAGALLEVL